MNFKNTDMIDKEAYDSLIRNTARDYDMSRWKVLEIYQNYYPDQFYEKLEEALKERERMAECTW